MNIKEIIFKISTDIMKIADNYKAKAKIYFKEYKKIILPMINIKLDVWKDPVK